MRATHHDQQALRRGRGAGRRAERRAGRRGAVLLGAAWPAAGFADHLRAQRPDPAKPTVRATEHPWTQESRSAGALRDFCVGSPEGIRTLATAVRGRRPRPLDDGALENIRTPHFRAGSDTGCYTTEQQRKDGGRVTSAGVLGLEPRMRESESLVLPITPYPNGTRMDSARTAADERYYLPCSPTRNPRSSGNRSCHRAQRARDAGVRSAHRPAPPVTAAASAPGPAAPSTRTAAARWSGR